MSETTGSPSATSHPAEDPALSVVVVSPAGVAQIERTLTALAAQTIAGRIELVVVASDKDVLARATHLTNAMHSARVLDVGTIENVDHAAAKGLLAGRAPIVASIEDHAYPEPEWAENLLAVWDDDCLAVGSAMRNANPSSRLSWSNILIAYGQWSETAPEGDTKWIALHNGSFRRAALEPYGDRLPEMFNREADILVALREDGGRFRFAPKARIRHLNPSRLGSTAQLRIDAGRLFAANRTRDEGWSLFKRLAYAALGPAIAPVRYARMRRQLFGPGRTVAESRHGVDLMIGLIFDALGQMAGFVLGPGEARARLSTFEMDRLDHLNERDRETFAPTRQSGPSR